MAEMAAVRQAAEQPMQRADLGRNRIAHRVINRQHTDLPPDRLGKPRGGLAGRCRQADTQRLAGLNRRRLQQRQQPHHSGGLAGTGAAGNDAETPARRQRTGDALPVRVLLTAGKQGVQPLRQIPGNLQWVLQALMQGRNDMPFVLPVAAQIQPLSDQHQRATALLRLLAINHPTGLQRPTPAVQRNARQYRRRQRRIDQALPFRRQRQGKIRFGQRGGQIQANMPMAQLMAHQRRRQQHCRAGFRRLLQQKPGEGPVQRPQPAVGPPVVQQLQQRVAAVQLRCRCGQRAQQVQLITLHGQSPQPVGRRTGGPAFQSARAAGTDGRGRRFPRPHPA